VGQEDKKKHRAAVLVFGWSVNSMKDSSFHEGMKRSQLLEEYYRFHGWRAGGAFHKIEEARSVKWVDDMDPSVVRWDGVGR